MQRKLITTYQKLVIIISYKYIIPLFVLHNKRFLFVDKVVLFLGPQIKENVLKRNGSNSGNKWFKCNC